MSVLYIKEQGAVVQKIGERISVTKGGKTLLDVPVIHVDNVSVIGNVQITTQALHMLMSHGVDVNYFSYSGKYLGCTAAEASKNIFLRFEQYRMYLDDTRRLMLARLIVSNKIRNQQAMMEYRRFGDMEYDWHNDVDRMEHYRQQLPEKKTSNEILGIEGICSNIYFGAFSKMLKGDFEFTERNRRPPKDPVNVILSLGYTFLTREICNALDSESFEPYLGFLHGIRYGRKSLALDIIEEFRQPVIDRLTIILFNKRMIGKYDFTFEEDGRVTLNEEGFRKFCSEYERWMNGKNSLAGEHFRKKIHSQIAMLKRFVRGQEEYIPYTWRNENVCD